MADAEPMGQGGRAGLIEGDGGDPAASEEEDAYALNEEGATEGGGLGVGAIEKHGGEDGEQRARCGDEHARQARGDDAGEGEGEHAGENERRRTPGDGEAATEAEQMRQAAYTSGTVGFEVGEGVGDVHGDAKERAEGEQPRQERLPAPEDGPGEQREEREVGGEEQCADGRPLEPEIVGEAETFDKQAEDERERAEGDTGKEHDDASCEAEGERMPGGDEAEGDRLIWAASVEFAVAVVVEGADGDLCRADGNEYADERGGVERTMGGGCGDKGEEGGHDDVHGAGHWMGGEQQAKQAIGQARAQGFHGCGALGHGGGLLALVEAHRGYGGCSSREDCITWGRVMEIARFALLLWRAV